MPLEFTALAGAGPDVRVLDPGGAPETIIDTDDTFTPQVRWSVEEPGAAVLGGRWLVRAYAESIGPGQEQQLGQTRFINVGNFTPIAGPPAAPGYEANVAVPAGTLAAVGDELRGLQAGRDRHPREPERVSYRVGRLQRRAVIQMREP
jgi:hypothetical protein